MLKPRRRKVAKQKLKGKTIYSVSNENGDVTFSVDALQVPGGVLYITAHHGFGAMNTVFVKDENIIKQKPSEIDYEKAYKFLTDTED